MQDRGWTLEALAAMDEAEFFLRWWATFGGPPAVMLRRAEMVSLILAERSGDGEARAERPGEAAPDARRCAGRRS